MKKRTLATVILGVLAISAHLVAQTTSMTDIFNKISSLFQQAAQLEAAQQTGTSGTTTTGTTTPTGSTTGSTGTPSTGSTGSTTGSISGSVSTGGTTTSTGGTTTTPSVASNISAVWANEGGDKVSQDELRASKHVENKTGTVINSAWNGSTIKLTSAKNEIVSFNLVLEAATTKATSVSVSFDTLTGPNGASITTTSTDPTSWTNRPIELFYARYVQIKGLSFFGYFKGDERQIPVRFQAASHVWTDRPDHDKMYPDALVPLELVHTFDIAQGQNQSIWADVYVPKISVPGVYTGKVTVTEGSVVTKTIPVSLTVQPFTLPDVPNAKVFANLDTNEIIKRYVDPSGNYVNWASAGGLKAVAVTDKYYQMFHRHKMDLIGDNDCPVGDKPCDTSLPRLKGTLFTSTNGYDGPGVSAGNSIFSIGTYGTWGAASYGIPSWRTDQTLFYQHIDAWQSWFNANLPNTEHFIYLADEPGGAQVAQVQNWAKWINNDPGVGKALLSFSTYPMVPAQTTMPDVDIPTTAGGIGNCPAGVSTCDNIAVNTAAAQALLANQSKRFWIYNDGRPGSGTLMTEAEGTDPRTLGWVQMKLGIQRWFYWFANVSCCGDFFQKALTWGSYNRQDNSIGWTGDDGTSNGNGFIVYPGTDLANPTDSYGINGPIASIRMKEWRRGIQDADYIALARQANAAAANTVVTAAVPKAEWENAAPGGDPSYFNGPISWSSNPDDWESSRAALAQIINTYCTTHAGTGACQ